MDRGCIPAATVQSFSGLSGAAVESHAADTAKAEAA